MRKAILLSLLSIITTLGTAQIKCYTNPLDVPVLEPEPPATPPGTLTPKAAKRLENRKKSLFFHETLMQIQEPSSVSFYGTDYTYNLSGYQKKLFVLNADVQTPIAIGGKRFTGKKGKWLSAIHVNPQFKIRIFSDDNKFPAGPQGDTSLSVRTPSTIPGITYYGALSRFWDPEETSGKFSFLNNLYFGLRLFHHSNGQDGSELDTMRSSNAGKVNIYNGNFGEQLVIELIIGGKTKLRRRESILDAKSNDRKLNRYLDSNGNVSGNDGKQISLKFNRDVEMFWKLGMEIHPAKLSNHTYDDLSIYGRNRLNAIVGYRFIPWLAEYIGNGKEWCNVMSERKFERWRYTLNFSYILDGDYMEGPAYDLEKVKFLDATKRLNLSFTTYWILPQTRNTAVFAQLSYYGSDNYNIYFAQSLWQFRYGLAFGIFNSSVEKDKI